MSNESFPEGEQSVGKIEKRAFRRLTRKVNIRYCEIKPSAWSGGVPNLNALRLRKT